ncbi:VC2046/SO_2500 family protein [Pseudoalteromonas fenneropenaei]|uniref:VC2046/SO_2500 family protein n=1 Tax=Pseudoalteromonas fenneropenaei TaxID=1737459 RepID=A0ABV7CIG3_9GAMM
MQIDGILLRESQLDSKLNESVHFGDRGEFGLLLAMLSQDALDFAQFHLPQSVQQAPERSEEQLRKELQIGPQRALAPETFDMLVAEEDAFVVQNFGMAAFRLKDCLQPEPLTIRNDKKHIPLHIVDNCEPAVRRKLQGIKQLANELPIDAAAFYDQLASGKPQSMLQVSA